MRKLKNKLLLLRSYILRRPYSDGIPSHFVVESTNKRNLSCPMCSRSMSPSFGHMGFELFRKIVDENRDAIELLLPFGAGEPLMNPRIFDMIAYCKRAGIKTELSTNATLLNREMSLKLLDSGLDYLILAFDGATPEVYEKYRKGAKFEKVRQNILEFLRLKLERRS